MRYLKKYWSKFLEDWIFEISIKFKLKQYVQNISVLNKNFRLRKLMFFITLVIIFGLNLLINTYLLNLIIYYLNRDIYTRLITKSNL